MEAYADTRGYRTQPELRRRARAGGHPKWGVAHGQSAFGITLWSVQPKMWPFFGSGPYGTNCSRMGAKYANTHQIGVENGPSHSKSTTTHSSPHCCQRGSRPRTRPPDPVAPVLEWSGTVFGDSGPFFFCLGWSGPNLSCLGLRTRGQSSEGGKCARKGIPRILFGTHDLPSPNQDSHIVSIFGASCCLLLAYCCLLARHASPTLLIRWLDNLAKVLHA